MSVTDMLPNANRFEFEYVGLKHYAPAPDGRAMFAIFGRLVAGELHQGNLIVVPASDGSEVVGQVSHFQESFYYECGLPFYHTVNVDPAPFCVFIAAAASGPQPRCPGRARQCAVT